MVNTLLEYKTCFLQGEKTAFPVEVFLELNIEDSTLFSFQFSPYTVVSDDICRILCIPRRTLIRSLQAYPSDKYIFDQNAIDIARVP